MKADDTLWALLELCASRRTQNNYTSLLSRLEQFRSVFKCTILTNAIFHLTELCSNKKQEVSNLDVRLTK